MVSEINTIYKYKYNIGSFFVFFLLFVICICLFSNTICGCPVKTTRCKPENYHEALLGRPRIDMKGFARINKIIYTYGPLRTWWFWW